MANTRYSKAAEKFLTGGINMAADTIKVAMIDTAAYTFNDTHEFYNSVAPAVVGTPQTLNNKSVTNGVFDADDVVFTQVTGPSIEAVVVYKDTGNPATSPVILYFDSAANLPITPNSGDLSIVWSNDAGRIFSI